MATLSGGITGLPNAGKSTIFNALTRGGASVADYPFCTVSPNTGVAVLPDPRLEKLANLIKPQVVTPATIEVVDVAGLIKGAHKGEGLGNEFLSRIRGVDVLIHLVRCFEGKIPHPEGSIDPIRDIETIKIELFLSDLNIIQRRLTRLNKLLKSPIKQSDKTIIEILHKVEKALNQGVYPEKVISSHEYQLIKQEGFLSLKPVIYVANISEEDIESPSTHIRRLREFAKKEGFELIEVCAQLEMELAEFPDDERQSFLKEMGIKERAVCKLAREIARKLNLITFFTITGGKEVRAWTIKEGSLAVEAAGKVHSDIKKGFIKAEVIDVEDLLEVGDFKKARAEGKVKLEGREYKVRDGDVIHFHFV
ncbi:redox-regulated ATPase YchF [Candidatus Aerophobetes bacterium]|nr:redox-regulated ATPase YchF [Candidatus Aerophobetes bacterium]